MSRLPEEQWHSECVLKDIVTQCAFLNHAMRADEVSVVGSVDYNSVFRKTELIESSDYLTDAGIDLLNQCTVSGYRIAIELLVLPCLVQPPDPVFTSELGSEHRREFLYWLMKVPWHTYGIAEIGSLSPSRVIMAIPISL